MPPISVSWILIQDNIWRTKVVLAAQKIQGKRVGGHGGGLSYLLCLFIMSFCLEEVASRIKGSWNYTPLMTNGKRKKDNPLQKDDQKRRGKKRVLIQKNIHSLSRELFENAVLLFSRNHLGCTQKLIKVLSEISMVDRGKYFQNFSHFSKKSTMWDNCVSQLFLWNRNNFSFY